MAPYSYLFIITKTYLFIIHSRFCGVYDLLHSNKFIFCRYVSRFETLDGNAVLQLDPAVSGVFNGPYPLGIDPVNTIRSPQPQKLIASSLLFVFSGKN